MYHRVGPSMKAENGLVFLDFWGKKKESRVADWLRGGGLVLIRVYNSDTTIWFLELWISHLKKSLMFQENSIEICILSRVKQITGPGWMHETSARTWCSGRTWRERVGREVDGDRDGEDMWTQGLFISMYDKIHYKLKKLKKKKLT